MSGLIIRVGTAAVVILASAWGTTSAQETAATVSKQEISISSVDALFHSTLAELSSAADKGDSGAALAMARALFADPDPAKQQLGVSYLERAADKNARGALEQLGDLYALGGYGRAPDPLKAREIYERAIEAGSIDALVSLGQLLLNSDFSPDGQRRGVELIKKAAAEGQVSASNALGQLYLEGRGVPADAEEALHYFAIGIVTGSNTAILNVGDALRTGARGLVANPAVALALFERSAREGDSSAGRRIADMRLRGEALPQDVAGAEDMLADLAAKGDAASLVALGDLYRDGEFVTMDISKAVGFYQQAANRDYASGATRLANIFMDGAPGIPIDVRRGLDFYDSAVEHGSTSAMRSLASIYLAGDVTSADPQRAIALLQRAVVAGDGNAAAALAALYANNDPFPADFEQVRKYLDLALVMGNSRAVIDVATAIAEGPLARPHSDDAYALLSGAVASNVPGAAARLARLQLDGSFPAQGLTGVISMLNASATGGDTAAAKFLLRLYRDGYGLLLKADAGAADAFLKTMEPVLGVEGAAVERITMAAQRSESIETLQAISNDYSLLTRANAVEMLNDLRRMNARAYVFVLQERLKDLGIYNGPLSGTLDTVTIRALRAACEQAQEQRACAPGPLTSGTARVLGTFLWEQRH